MQHHVAFFCRSSLSDAQYIQEAIAPRPLRQNPVNQQQKAAYPYPHQLFPHFFPFLLSLSPLRLLLVRLYVLPFAIGN